MEVKDYWPNGFLRFTKYLTPEGEVHEEYYENGQMKYKHVFRDGKAYGTQKGWFPDGKVKYVGSYNNRGKEDGLYRKYDARGREIERITYNNGAPFA